MTWYREGRPGVEGDYLSGVGVIDVLEEMEWLIAELEKTWMDLALSTAYKESDRNSYNVLQDKLEKLQKQIEDAPVVYRAEGYEFWGKEKPIEPLTHKAKLVEIEEL